MILIRFVARTYPPCWVIKARIQKHPGKPLLFHDKCPGFFYVHYTTHGTYTFTSHPKDEAIMVKCLAQGHKRRDRPGRDSNPHSGNTRTWVQCTRPLGHNTPCVLQINQGVHLANWASKRHPQVLLANTMDTANYYCSVSCQHRIDKLFIYLFFRALTSGFHVVWWDCKI